MPRALRRCIRVSAAPIRAHVPCAWPYAHTRAGGGGAKGREGKAGRPKAVPVVPHAPGGVRWYSRCVSRRVSRPPPARDDPLPLFLGMRNSLKKGEGGSAQSPTQPEASPAVLWGVLVIARAPQSTARFWNFLEFLDFFGFFLEFFGFFLEFFWNFSEFFLIFSKKFKKNSKKFQKYARWPRRAAVAHGARRSASGTPHFKAQCRMGPAHPHPHQRDHRPARAPLNKGPPLWRRCEGPSDSGSFGRCFGRRAGAAAPGGCGAVLPCARGKDHLRCVGPQVRARSWRRWCRGGPSVGA